jgi:hypothetical protein
LIAVWAALLYLPLYLPRREFDLTRYKQIVPGMPEAKVEELLGGSADTSRPPEDLPPLRSTGGSLKYWVFERFTALQIVEVHFDASGRVTVSRVFFRQKPSPWRRLLRAFGLR